MIKFQTFQTRIIRTPDYESGTINEPPQCFVAHNSIVHWSGAVPSSADTQRVVRGGGLGYPPRTHGVPAGEGCGGG